MSVFNGQTLKQPALCAITGVHNKSRCEAMAFHPDNSYFVTGGHDSLVAFWQLDELVCSGTLAANHF